MQQEKDDNLDRFFKKALHHEDRSFLEQDWKDLEKLLDQNIKPKPWITTPTVKWTASLLLLAAFISLYFLFNTKPIVINVSPNAAEILQPLKGQANPDVPKANENELASPEKLKSLSSEDTREVVAQNNNHDLRNRIPQQPRQLAEGNPGLRQQQIFQKSLSAQPVIDEAENDGAAVLETVNPEAIFERGKVVQVQDGSLGAASLISERAAQLQMLGDSSKVVAEEPEVKLTEGETADQESDKEETIRQNRLFIGALYAPDFSLTPSSSISAPGIAYGAIVGYRFLGRFSLLAGYIKTTKKYIGSGSEYHPPYDYWEKRTNGIIPEEVTGRCAVTEIPVIIQFDALQAEKFRLFLAAGLSSYRMTSESYEYHFAEENPGAASNWSTTTPSSYTFSVGHFSVGYERWIRKNFTLGVEPFVKVPFAEIGWSNVTLYTTGAYLNVRYYIK